MAKFLLILFSLFYLVPVHANTPDEIRAAIQNQISQRHPGPSAPFWSSLGPEALPVIEQMYAESKSTPEKMWLLDGMGYFSDPKIGTFLQDQITNEKNSLMKKKMLGAYIHSQGDAALDFAEPFLKDTDANVRAEVASDLKRYADSQAVRARVAKFQSEEKLEWVRERVQTQDHEPLLKRVASVPEPADAKPSPTPLPEKAWAGEWKGVFLDTKKSGLAIVNLKLLKADAAPSEQKWKIELTLPKQSKIELQGKDVSLSYYLSKGSHWIEIRDLQGERVVICRRPIK